MEIPDSAGRNKRVSIVLNQCTRHVILYAIAQDLCCIIAYYENSPV